MSVKQQLSRLAVIISVVVLAIVVVVPTVRAQTQPRLLNRSLDIHTSEPGATTDYTFSWRLPSPFTVGSVRLQFCDDPYLLDACSGIPPGDFSASTLGPGDQSGSVTGFSILSQTADEVILTRTPSVAGTGQSTYELRNVVNPTGVDSSFFVRIYVYPTADGTGSPNVYAAVANATASPISINTEVPPILYFCAGLTIDEWCENVIGNQIDYGDLSPAVTDVGNSQFGAATNALGGYVITVNGKTMTSGNKEIPELATPSSSIMGTAQFGLNLRANTDPATGQDVSGAGIGVVAANYDTPDLFQYVDGDIVATAITGTMFNTYTATYIVNVPPDQPSGVYNTTITYICTAAF